MSDGYSCVYICPSGGLRADPAGASVSSSSTIASLPRAKLESSGLLTLSTFTLKYVHIGGLTRSQKGGSTSGRETLNVLFVAPPGHNVTGSLDSFSYGLSNSKSRPCNFTYQLVVIL